MQKQTIHWPSAIIFASLGLATLTFLGLSVALAFSSIYFLFTGEGDALGPWILSFGLIVETVLLAVAVVLSLRRVMEKENLETSARVPYAPWQLFAAFSVVTVCLIIGYFISDSNILWLGMILLPLLSVLVVVLPVWVFMGMGTFDLELGPRWRAWSVFGLGLSLGPLIMVILEAVTGAIIGIVLIIYLASLPGMSEKLLALSMQLQTMADPEQALNILAPYFLNPGVVAVVILYAALIVPMIEEMFKPIGVWIFGSKLTSPAQGLAFGVISGAAYALMESMGASAQAGSGWAMVVAARAGTTLLHITTTGLMGWAIASAWKEKRYLQLIGTYALSISLHGLWNASAVIIAVYSMALESGSQSVFEKLTIPALALLAILLVVCFATLFFANKQARESIPLAVSDASL